MGNEHGEWILYGTRPDDPHRIKDRRQLVEVVNEVGFLPLFKNEIDGFSVEERTLGRDWWSGDAEADPWRWREFLPAQGEVAYGKFFDRKAGFVSLAWLPRFANARRDGYDFDALWDDGKASWRSKKLMDLFLQRDALFSYELKALGGFHKGGEKNFEGTLAELQMQTYLVIRDFRRRLNRRGEPYGWHIAQYAMPESIWGYQLLSSAYGEAPEASRQAIYAHIRSLYPQASEAHIKKLLR